MTTLAPRAFARPAGRMMLTGRGWWARYCAEERRRFAAARMDYGAEAAWALVLAILRGWWR